MKNHKKFVFFIILSCFLFVFQLANAAEDKLVVTKIGKTIDGKIVCKVEYMIKNKEYMYIHPEKVCKDLRHDRMLVTKDGTVYEIADEMPAQELIHSNKYEKKEVQVTGDLYEGVNFKYLRVKSFKKK